MIRLIFALSLLLCGNGYVLTSKDGLVINKVLSMNNHSITNVPQPTGENDVASKAYVDAATEPCVCEGKLIYPPASSLECSSAVHSGDNVQCTIWARSKLYQPMGDATENSMFNARVDCFDGEGASTSSPSPSSISFVSAGKYEFNFVPSEEGKCVVTTSYFGTELPSQEVSVGVCEGSVVSCVSTTCVVKTYAANHVPFGDASDIGDVGSLVLRGAGGTPYISTVWSFVTTGEYTMELQVTSAGIIFNIRLLYKGNLLDTFSHTYQVGDSDSYPATGCKDAVNRWVGDGMRPDGRTWVTDPEGGASPVLVWCDCTTVDPVTGQRGFMMIVSYDIDLRGSHGQNYIAQTYGSRGMLPLDMLDDAWDDYNQDSVFIQSILNTADASLRMHIRCHRDYTKSLDDYMFGDIFFLTCTDCSAEPSLCASTNPYRLDYRIRGYNCAGSGADFKWWSTTSPHTDSSNSQIPGWVGSEDNFGGYGNRNPNHLCANNDGETIIFVEY